MRTLLVGLNAKYIHSAAAVYSLAAYAREHAAASGEIRELELSINQSHDELLYRILREEADCLAFSVYIWNVGTVTRLLRDLRALRPEAVLILGGPEVSYGLAQTGIAEEDYDYLIAGEGERAFAGLLLKLSACPVPAYLGLSVQGKTVRGAVMADLDELPFYFAGRMERFAGRILYYEASRGCPYHCSYCLSAAEDGLRLKSTARVLEELSYLCEHGASLIKFVDRSFNARPDAVRILEYLSALPEENPVRVHFEIEADTLTEPLLQAFSRLPAGRVQVEAGIQSTNPETLGACHRNPSTDRLFANLRRLLEGGNLKVHADLIAGLPYETAERFRRSFSESYALGVDELQLGFLKRLSGAPLASETELGLVFSPHPPYEILRSPWISADELMALKKVEDVLERFSNAGRFRAFMETLSGKMQDAYVMFEKLAAYLEERDKLFMPLSNAEEFALLAGFAGNDIGLLRALLRDFYASSSAEPPEGALRELAGKPEGAAAISRELMKKAGLPGHRLQVRFLEGEPLLYDYSEGSGRVLPR